LRPHLTFNRPNHNPAFTAKQPSHTYKRLLGAAFACVIGAHSLSPTFAATSDDTKKAQTFSQATVISLAQQLAQTPFKEARKAPKELIDLDYATYGKINYQENAAIWGGTPTKFSVQLIAPGFL
jgi:glucan biosynthesis protein